VTSRQKVHAIDVAQIFAILGAVFIEGAYSTAFALAAATIFVMKPPKPTLPKGPCEFCGRPIAVHYDVRWETFDKIGGWYTERLPCIEEIARAMAISHRMTGVPS